MFFFLLKGSDFSNSIVLTLYLRYEQFRFYRTLSLSVIQLTQFYIFMFLVNFSVIIFFLRTQIFVFLLLLNCPSLFFFLILSLLMLILKYTDLTSIFHRFSVVFGCLISVTTRIYYVFGIHNALDFCCLHVSLSSL